MSLGNSPQAYSKKAQRLIEQRQRMGHGSKIQVSRQIQYDGSTALAQSAVRRMMVNQKSGTMMTESKLEVPAELRELA